MEIYNTNLDINGFLVPCVIYYEIEGAEEIDTNSHRYFEVDEVYPNFSSFKGEDLKKLHFEFDNNIDNIKDIALDRLNIDNYYEL